MSLYTYASNIMWFIFTIGYGDALGCQAKKILHLVMSSNPEGPVLYTPPILITKGRRNTDPPWGTNYTGSTYRFPMQWWRNSSKSGSELGFGLSSRGRRLPRRGREHFQGQRLGLSFVLVREQSVSCELSYPSAFYRFVHCLIENWMDIVGGWNCEFRVLSYFLFGNEHWWAEVHRQM